LEAVLVAKSKLKRKRAPKSVLKLPDLEQSKSAVLDSLTSPSSQRTYDHAIREFIEWYCSEPRLAFNKTVVTRYRISLEQQHYASTTINLRLAAVRTLAYEAGDSGLLSADLAAGIRRVKGAKRLGVPVGNWLTAEQGKVCWLSFSLRYYRESLLRQRVQVHDPPLAVFRLREHNLPAFEVSVPVVILWASLSVKMGSLGRAKAI
jgi:hypothetical protein